MNRMNRKISFLFAVLPGAISVAIAEPKAEPLSVQFKNGSAMLKGSIGDDEQYEYAVATKKGQWMMIEVVSNPVDAAVFRIKLPNGEETNSLYAWSETVSQAGEYEIDVYKPADYKTAKFTLNVTLSWRPPAPMSVAKDRSSLALQAAMRKFILAFRTRDKAAFLSLFSRARPSYHLNPMNIGSKSHYRSAVTYRELSSDIKKKKGLYWMYLEREYGLDAFIDNIPDRTMWTKVKGNKFVPPGDDVTSRTYVKWRRESGRWVIDEISYGHA